MCNPIASKIIERNKIMEITVQQHQQNIGGRIDDETEDDAGENRNSSPNTNNTTEAAPPSVGFSSATTTAAAAAVAVTGSADAGHPSNDTMEDNIEESTNDNVDKNKNKDGIDSIREYDVLMGRGSGPNRHSGNIHFRAIVGEVFDDFLSKHGSSRPMIGDNGSDAVMLRIDPSTKNRLAQAVLDKISLEKEGRFLQKLNKREIADAIKNGTAGKLIKARAVTFMDVAMTSVAMATVATTENDTEQVGGVEIAATPVDSSHEKVAANAVVYYKIIPEKQILAKIKQTFRFLRDQNEASNAEKQRQRVRRVAAAAASCGLPRDQLSLSANSLGGIGGMQIPGGLSNSSTMAVTYALMERMGANAGMNYPLNTLNVNPSPLPDQLNFTNNANANGSSNVNTSSNGNLWAATRGLNNIVVPPATSMTMNAIKSMNHANNPGGAMGYSTVASRLLCDLPQPKRILSNSDAKASPSLLQGSSLAAAVSQLDSNSNKIPSPLDNSAERFLEELTLSRLANLQKQREATINAYLAMERTSGGAQGSAAIGNTASHIDGVGVSPATIPSQQLQRLLNLNAAAPNPLHMAPVGNTNALGSLGSTTLEPLSLLLQLNNNQMGRNSNNINRSSGNHPLRAFNSF
jgi:hypothetical protein